MPAASVVTLSATRTPIGRYGGSFRDLHPADLGAVAARAAMERAGVADIDEVVMGHGRQAGSGPNPARQIGYRAGVPDAAPTRRRRSTKLPDYPITRLPNSPITQFPDYPIPD